jgi:hypothetical protein
MPRMPLERYARFRNVSGATIRWQVKQGIIERSADGTIDSEQADANWYSTKLGRSSREADGVAFDSRLTRARLASTVAKTQLARFRFGELRDSVVNRSEAVTEALAEVETLLREVNGVDPSPIEALGLTPQQAKDLTTDFVAMSLAELGDVTAEVGR